MAPPDDAGPAPTPGRLRVHRATRIDALLPELAHRLSQAPPDPFTPEIIAVPTRGVERYLTQQLSQRLGTSSGGTDGVCAGVSFPSPNQLFGELTADISGVAYDDDPWRVERLVWPVLDVIDNSLGEPWAAPLRTHVTGSDGGGRPGRRLRLARTVAALFDRYGVERPSLIRDWRAGHDSDGAGGSVPPACAWQPVLWRLVAARLDVPAPPERTPQVLAVLRDDPGRVDLPERLSILGATRLPAAHLDLARGLAEHRDVHLWLPDPSPTRWAAIAAMHPTPPMPRRRVSPLPTLTDDPLLRSLGRDSGELAWRLLTDGDTGDVVIPDRPDSMLGRLQRRVSGEPPGVGSRDATIQFHACHGRARQVEVLREVLLSLLQADPTLEPRDVIVLCPDLAGYTSLVQAAFDSVTVADGRTVDLRVRVADRTSAQDNQVLAALSLVFDLAVGRVTRSALLDLAAQPAVRARFGFDDDALERFDELADQTQVRWGLDLADRRRADLPLPHNTWSSGVDRMLLGVAMADDGMLTATVPAAGITGTEVPTIGNLAEFVDRIRLTLPELRTARPLSEWVTLLNSVIPGLFDATGPDSWQVPAALGAVARWSDDAADHDPTLDIGDLRVWLADLRTGRPTRANFRTGGVTVCSLAPMRAVPYRVVCLLGLDDATFPRATRAAGDDLTARDPILGERDPASEDRQQLLDAIMAAGDHVIITYAGRDVRTNQVQPPAVPVGELLDALADLTGDDPQDLVTRHPLQPFDPRNFSPDDPFGHDPAALAGAEAVARPSVPAPPFFTGPVPPDQEPESATVDDLVTFLGSPAEYFLRRRLGLPRADRDTGSDEQVPIRPDGLTTWGVGDRLVRGLLNGENPDDLCRREIARGVLPPHSLGRTAYEPIAALAATIARQPQAQGDVPPRDVPVSVTLPSGASISGVVGGVRGDHLVTVGYSRLKDKTILGSWVRQLALAAVGLPLTAVIVAQADKDSDGEVAIWRSTPPSRADALTELDLLVRLWRDNHTAPVPFLPTTSRAYVDRRHHLSPEEALSRISADWRVAQARPDRHKGADAVDAAVRRLWVDFDGLTAEPPRPGEPADGPSRFGALARRVWSPILAHGTRHVVGVPS
ncbi:MAG: exodeoxyribonuclease V subunit gamma [Candidatus Nanopelagicales bacterium]